MKTRDIKAIIRLVLEAYKVDQSIESEDYQRLLDELTETVKTIKDKQHVKRI